MKIKLDTKNKEIVFEKAITLKQMRMVLRFLLPEDYDNLYDGFMISTGTISGKAIIELDMPLKIGYNYSPAFEWIKYTGGAGVSLDGNSCTCKISEKDSNSSAVSLVDGTYIINMNNI